jgi:hypothetical protein
VGAGVSVDVGVDSSSGAQRIEQKSLRLLLLILLQFLLLLLLLLRSSLQQLLRMEG